MTLIIGDLMLDIHLKGECTRISPEAPVPIVRINEEATTLGAAANVASQIASYGINCYLAYKSRERYPGQSSSHNTAENLMIQKGIGNIPLHMKSKNTCTTLKKRIWAGSQQICRIDYEDTTKPDDILSLKWLKKIEGHLNHNDVKVVVFSDYDKGTLTNDLIQTVGSMCKSMGIKTVLDPKRHDFYTIEDLTIIKPNRYEMESTKMSKRECSKRLSHTYLVNTLDKDGVEIWRHGEMIHKSGSLVNPKNIVDRCGCGDIFCAILAICLHENIEITRAVEIASKAVTYSISQTGSYVLNKDELNECFK